MVPSQKNSNGTLCLPIDDPLAPGEGPAALHTDATRVLPARGPDPADPGDRLTRHAAPTIVLPAPADPSPPAARRAWYRRKDAGTTAPPDSPPARQEALRHEPTQMLPADTDASASAGPEPTRIVPVEYTRIVELGDGTQEVYEPTIRWPLPPGTEP